MWKGKCIHAYVIRSGIVEGVNVGNSLVAMYAKCGSIDVALQFFDNIKETWFHGMQSLLAIPRMDERTRH